MRICDRVRDRVLRRPALPPPLRHWSNWCPFRDIDRTCWNYHSFPDLSDASFSLGRSSSRVTTLQYNLILSFDCDDQLLLLSSSWSAIKQEPSIMHSIVVFSLSIIIILLIIIIVVEE